MELQKAIEGRRSIRAFKTDTVSNEQITEIIKAGMLAPSAKNGQPWSFTVVRGEEKENICRALEAFARENPDLKTSAAATAAHMRKANALILVFIPRRITRIAERAPWQYLIPELSSVGACFENMSLKAFDMGLGSLWVCDLLYISDYFDEGFGKDTIAGALCVGYPDEQPEARPRRSFEKVVVFR